MKVGWWRMRTDTKMNSPGLMLELGTYDPCLTFSNKSTSHLCPPMEQLTNLWNFKFKLCLKENIAYTVHWTASDNFSRKAVKASERMLKPKTKIALPDAPVVFEPHDKSRKSFEKEYNVSAKA